MKNKKILSLILGTAMIASMPLAGVKAADPEPPVLVGDRLTDADYNGFNEDLDGEQIKSTEILAAIPEYTLDIPADTAIKRGALQADLGDATVTGNYFYKPYGVDVSISKQNFYKATLNATTNALEDQDSTKQIKFSVQDAFGDTATGGPGNWSGGANPWTDLTDVNDTTPIRYAYHFYTNGDNHDYDLNRVSSINESRKVVLNIPAEQWTNAMANAGIYHASLTFNAEICTNTTKGQGHTVTAHNPNTEILPEENG